MRRTLSTAALLLSTGCLGDLLNIGEGPDEKGGGGGKTGETGGSSGASGTAGASGGSGGSGGAGASGGSGAADTGGEAGAGSDTGGSPSRGGAAGGGSGGARGGSGGAGAGGTAGKGEVTTDPDVIALAAVVLGSCYPDDGVSRNASEMWNYREHDGFWRNFRLQAECIAQAGQGCDALDTCMGWAIEEAPGCTPGRVCDGSTLIHCAEDAGGENVAWRLDCATIDLECDVRAYCVSEPVVACDEATYVMNCSDEKPQSCNDTGEGRPDSEEVIFPGPDCAALGLVCAAGVVGGYEPIECTGTGDSCDLILYGIFDAMACTGSTLETCVNGRRHDLDCSTYGPDFSCQSYEGIPFCGLASECLPADLFDYGPDISQDGDPVPFCDGTSIVFCNAGRMERIDCTELGFTGCDVDIGLGCIPSPTSDLRE